MRWLWCLALTACSEVAPLPPVDIPLRNPTAPIASQADVTLDRLAGNWVLVAGAGIDPGTSLAVTENAIRIGEIALPLRDLGQGRLRVGDEELWVHWLDVGDRTAVIGNPEGKRVWIMDRTGTPGDRLQPAREILDWYGYDLDRLEDA